MSITVEAIYEAGMLKPLKPIPSLEENTRVRLVIATESTVSQQRRARLRLEPAAARDLIENPEYSLLER
jgi:predicted DNA-binding antitoxin AbrB/MazE fold protein